MDVLSDPQWPCLLGVMVVGLAWGVIEWLSGR